MLWLHLVTSLEWWETLSLFPGRPESQLSFHCEKRWKHQYVLILRWNRWWSFAKLIQWCSVFSGPVRYVPLWSMKTNSLGWYEFGAIPLHGFNFVLMIRILQCNIIMFHMWWLYCIIYIYKSDYMCADICSDILCSRQKKNIQISSHHFNICSWFDQMRRVWRVVQGDPGPALQGVLAVNLVICLGGNWWKLLISQCACEDFGRGILGKPICLVIRISVASSRAI